MGELFYSSEDEQCIVSAFLMFIAVRLWKNKLLFYSIEFSSPAEDPEISSWSD